MLKQIKTGPTYDLGNCVKDNKTDWGWSPWSSGLQTYMLLLLRFLRFLRFFKIQKTWLFTFFAVFHTFSRTMVVTLSHVAAYHIQRTCIVKQSYGKVIRSDRIMLRHKWKWAITFERKARMMTVGISLWTLHYSFATARVSERNSAPHTSWWLHRLYRHNPHC